MFCAAETDRLVICIILLTSVSLDRNACLWMPSLTVIFTCALKRPDGKTHCSPLTYMWHCPLNFHLGGWMGDEVLTLLKANMRIQNKTRKEALLSTTSSMANPLRIPPSTTQCFLSRVQLGRKPSVRTLAGSQGYVTMQLTVVLIRKSLAVGAQNICFSKGVGR